MPTRSTARPSCSRHPRHVRAGAVGRPDAGRCWRRATAPGEKPLYYTQTPNGLRLASEIKALLSRPEVDRTRRSRGARPVPDLRVHHRAADDLQGHPQAAARALSRLPRRRGDGAALLGRGRRRAVRAWTEGRRGEALRETLAQGGPQPDDGGRPDRAVPLRRHRFERGRRACCATRRAPRPCRSFSMGFDDGSYNELPFAREVAALCGTQHYRGDGHARRRRAVRSPGRPSRRAVRRRLAVSDVPRLADGARAREGRADRRRRRRAVRRLRRLRGGGAGRRGGPDCCRRRAVARGRRGARRWSRRPRRRRGWSTRRGGSSTAWRTRRRRSRITGG